MNKLLALLPLLVAILIGIAGWWGLTSDRDPSAIPSALIGQLVPQFDLPEIPETKVPGLSTQNLMDAQEPIMVNVFASWCLPCRAEHVVLVGMVANENLNLVGINYKDKPDAAAKWLEELGNPYRRIGSDQTGRAGIEWGISGVPETFIVAPDGRIAFRHVGAIASDADLAKIRNALAVAAGKTP